MLNRAKLITLVIFCAGFLIFAWGMVSIVETYKHRYADIVLTSGWVCIAAGLVILLLSLLLLTKASMELLMG